MADAVFYNTIAWCISGSENYSTNAVNFIKTWFIDPATSMNPNRVYSVVFFLCLPDGPLNPSLCAPTVNYAQLLRGPGKQVGQPIGILDLKCMSKIATAILTLRLGGSSEWTPEIDQSFTKWLHAYIPWMTNNTLAHQERATPKSVSCNIFRRLL